MPFGDTVHFPAQIYGLFLDPFPLRRRSFCKQEKNYLLTAKVYQSANRQIAAFCNCYPGNCSAGIKCGRAGRFSVCHSDAQEGYEGRETVCEGENMHCPVWYNFSCFDVSCKCSFISIILVKTLK